MLATLLAPNLAQQKTKTSEIFCWSQEQTNCFYNTQSLEIQTYVNLTELA